MAFPVEQEPSLDRFIDDPDVDEAHAVIIYAPIDLVMDTAQKLRLDSVPIVRAIFWLRGKILGSSAEDRRQPQGLIDEMIALGWRKLAEIPGRKLIMGAVTQPWRADVHFTPVSPEHFASYAEPDHVKIVWTLEAQPLGEAVTRFRTETRAVATDRVSQGKFRRYWRRFGSGAVLIRRILLRVLRQEAERRFMTHVHAGTTA